MSNRDRFLTAVERGDLPQVEIMLRDNSLAQTTAPGGVPILLHALHRGHHAVAAAIAARRSELTVAEAAALGDVDRLRARLVLRPSELNAPSGDGYPPLALAVLFAQPAAVQALLEAGADPHQPSAGDNGQAPMHLAVRHGQPGVALGLVRLLLDGGADPDLRAPGGWTALHHAAALGYREVCLALVDAGADRAPVAENGRTPAQVARQFGFVSVAETLERDGA